MIYKIARFSHSNIALGKHYCKLLTFRQQDQNKRFSYCEIEQYEKKTIVYCVLKEIRSWLSKPFRVCIDLVSYLGSCTYPRYRAECDSCSRSRSHSMNRNPQSAISCRRGHVKSPVRPFHQTHVYITMQTKFVQ